jgi:hypothetical protein
MVEDDLKSQNEKLGIVTRFVEWFTSRGENYEHNLKIIDKHLSNLAANSSNSDGKSPYIGQIRFASVVADQRN